MKNIKIIIILIFSSFSLLSCQNKKMEEKYKWTATLSAPQEYPMEVYDGFIKASADEKSYFGFDAIWGTQNTGWGENGGTMGDRMSELPDTLEMTWLSLVEKKFYTGKWKLDREKITQLFKEGFMDEDTGKKKTYDEFRIGLAPKGRVVLWINGIGYQKEVGVFQAHDTIITKEQAYENAQYMFRKNYAEDILNDPEYKTFKPDVREHIDKFGYPDPNVYNIYREKYNWKPVIKLPENEQTISVMGLYYNGEQENLFGDDLIKNIYVSRAVPRFVSFSWKDQANNKYAIWIDPFDEKEIISCFQQLGKEENIELRFEISNDNKDCVIFLKNASGEIEIKKANITIEKLKH